MEPTFLIGIIKPFYQTLYDNQNAKIRLKMYTSIKLRLNHDQNFIPIASAVCNINFKNPDRHPPNKGLRTQHQSYPISWLHVYTCVLIYWTLDVHAYSKLKRLVVRDIQDTTNALLYCNITKMWIYC